MDNRLFDQPPMQGDELPADLQATALSYAASRFHAHPQARHRA